MRPSNEFLELAPAVKAFREHLLNDRERPGYHFCIPEGRGEPGDPNGAFYANGRYHLMYLYWHEDKGFCWGHVSSVDLLHWRHHPDCIVAGIHGIGCFSGGAFLDDDGKCYISFWDFVEDKNASEFGGIRIVVSDGEPYEEWTILPDYAVRCNVACGVATVKDRAGKEHIVGAADPSNIWKKDGKYYMQTGNLVVLEQYSRGENPPLNLRGDWVDLFSSDDLKKWDYEGRFYDRKECPGTEDSEDDMCPSFLPLPMCREGGEQSGKYLQLFISHNRGCQYYVGTYDRLEDRFHPETRGRMSVVDSAYFAPEALVAPDGRQIMWSWLLDNPEDSVKNGWSCVYGMARELWHEKADNTLRMAPAKEYENLRINGWKKEVEVRAEDVVSLDIPNGLSFEMKLEGIKLEDRGNFEVRVRVSDDEKEYTAIWFDTETSELIMDTTKGSVDGWPAVERMPVVLPDDEPLTLTIFVDHSVVEIYANDRAAIVRRVYPASGGKGVHLKKRGNGCVLQTHIWEMAPCNPF